MYDSNNINAKPDIYRLKYIKQHRVNRKFNTNTTQHTMNLTPLRLRRKQVYVVFKKMTDANIIDKSD